MRTPEPPFQALTLRRAHSQGEESLFAYVLFVSLPEFSSHKGLWDLTVSVTIWDSDDRQWEDQDGNQGMGNNSGGGEFSQLGAHVCNPSIPEAEAGGLRAGGYRRRPHFKRTKGKNKRVILEECSLGETPAPWSAAVTQAVCVSRAREAQKGS